MSLSDAHYFEEMGVKKYEEIHALLDSREKKDKLEGMKRLMAMISIGRDASNFFPDVVKQVISDSLEVKKLAYQFLTHYAEAKSNEALLCINTFQKDLNDTNQLIRSSALRVLTSIRVPIIAQLQTMAVKQCVRDSSAYVRKAAAHAVAKVYALDPEQSEALEELVQVLLGDSSTMVLGSAVAAFNEVCPHKWELIHPNFRKIVRLCADTDEWGQIMLLNMLTRYGRMFFTKPDKDTDKNPKPPADGQKKKKKKKKTFYSDDDSSSSSSSSSESEEEEEEEEEELDADHATMLSATLPLLRSRNAGVVVGVATLLHYTAPRSQVVKAGKSLVRVLKNNRETQYLVLQNIATLVQTRPDMFEGMAKEFFLRAHDCTCSALLKLEILSQLVNEGNAQLIMREFNAYIKEASRDPVLIAATIQAIGRAAAWMPSLTDSCLRGLMQLIQTSKREDMVAESVVVVRALVQQAPEARVKIVRQLVRLMDKMKVPCARASVVWMLGAYHHLLPKVAPDALRELAKTFKTEDSQVKLQVLNLACKLFVSQAESSDKLFIYLLDLCKYDMDFDIRDRARMLRTILLSHSSPMLREKSRSMFLTARLAPEFVAPSMAKAAFVLNTLSHVVSHHVTGYMTIADHPDEVPSSSIREPLLHSDSRGGGGDASKGSGKDDRRSKKEVKNFYKDSSSSSSGSDSDSDDTSHHHHSSASNTSDSSKSSGSGSDSEDSDSSPSDSDSDSDSNSKNKNKKNKKHPASSNNKASSSSSSDSDSDSDSDSESEADKRKKQKQNDKEAARDAAKKKKEEKEKEKESKEKDKAAAKKAANNSSTGKDDKGGGTTKHTSKHTSNPKPKGGGASLIELGDESGVGGAGGGSLIDAATPKSVTNAPTLTIQAAALAGVGGSGTTAKTPTGRLVSSVVDKSKLLSYTLLHFANGGGLNVEYCFTREDSFYGAAMNTIKLVLHNTTNLPLTNLRVGELRLETAMQLQPFGEVASLPAGGKSSVNLYIDFAGNTRPAKFDILTDKGAFAVQLTAPAGELVAPLCLSETEFDTLAKGLKGMHEAKQATSGLEDKSEEAIKLRVTVLSNLYPLENVAEKGEGGGLVLKFAGRTMNADRTPLLITVDVAAGVVRGNSENTLLSRQITKDIKETLSK